MHITQQHRGRRLLICERWGTKEYPEEVIVVDVSPSGRVKLRWPNTVEIWYPAYEYEVLEVLSGEV